MRPVASRCRGHSALYHAARCLVPGEDNVTNDDGKTEWVGKENVAKFDIAVDKSSGQIVLVNKEGLTVIETGVFRP